MADIEIKTKLKESILSFANGDLAENGIKFFKTLGYVTDRQARLDSPNYETFRDSYIYEISKFNEEKALVSHWKYVDILFQLSREEVLKQMSLFDTKQVDRTIIETYLFITIELTQPEYNRTELSQITREVNRLFPMPVLILFKHGQSLTLSVINRRLHKRDDSKDVLEKVTQIKDINISNPHRAHIEILFDLSFDELNYTYKFTNFVELHNAWQKTLDTKELNKRFYNELFNWYLWAVRSVKFPNDVDDDKDDTVYNSESVIRLLTRLVFVWFIKEKGLVPDVLFDEQEIKKVLKNFNPISIDTSAYYRAILQNLFFATLNTQMDKDVRPEEKRRFVNLEPRKNNPDYTDQTKYRYKDYFINPEEALKLFSTVPFLNGGLFECLDSKETDPKTKKEREFRYDGFSTYKEKQAFVPDKLFFAPEFSYDLNGDYGTKNKSYKVEGLLNILNSYKFTITENTPLDEEIALDPELLGKVFENLLASYNPETQTTARKQTGSFYTPRDIVNYMVDESLIAYLKQKLSGTKENEEKLRQLFAPVEQIPPFTFVESQMLVNALSTAKILDPACGSGAFPMGILHRMVDLLKKLDPENKLWFELQKKRAIDETAEVFDSGDTQEREIRLSEINKAFDLGMNFPDYARKLFLIENCIYGVDIQQIAIQISKLRFFISLIVDQKVDDNKPNRNILSMPNLETRFVAANTLIGLEKPDKIGYQYSLLSEEVSKLEKELISIRHKIFFTRKYHDKKELKKQDKAKRQELEKALESSGYTKNTAAQMAGWNPFDPIASANFFDTETMFGFTDGFDVVIGNPPYGVKLANKDLYKKLFPKTSFGNIDSYKYFTDKAIQLTNEGGSLCFITSDSFLEKEYFVDLRSLMLANSASIVLIKLGDNIFENVNLPTAIFHQKVVHKDATINLMYADLSHYNLADKIKYLSSEKSKLLIKTSDSNLSFSNKESIINTTDTNKLIDIYDQVMGVKVYQIGKGSPRQTEYEINNDIFISDRKIGDEWMKFIDSGVKRYFIEATCKYIRYGEWLAEPRDSRFFNNPKVIIREVVNPRIFAAFMNEPACIKNTNAVIIQKDKKYSLKYLLAIVNSNLFNYYINENSAKTGNKSFPSITSNLIKNFPVKKTNEKNQNNLHIITEYISLQTQLGQKQLFFDRLVDAIVYELYLPEQIKSANCEILKHLTNLPQLKDGKDEATLNANLQIIEKVQNELSDPKHPVNKAMDKMEAIEEIRIIEGKK